MLRDQNRIDFQPETGYYDEYHLADDSTDVLPGAFVDLVGADDAPNAIDFARCTGTASDVTTMEPYIAIDDTLQGRDLNTKYLHEQPLIDGSTGADLVRLRRAISGDRYMARCLAAKYAYNDLLWFVQGTYGVYVTKTDPGDGSKPRAKAIENYEVTAEMVDPANVVPGGVVNLLRVRIL